MTYPSGTVLNYNYGTANGTNDVISRLDNLSETNGNVTTTLESYSYLGLGTVVKRAHPEDGVDLTYIKQVGESNGDAGDQYNGLDRFGRVVDQRWINANGTDVDRYTYTYDRDSNVTSKENEVAWHAPLIHSDFYEAYTYDGLNRLTSTDRYNGTSADQSFTLDANDNITGLTTGGSLVNRTSNDFNQLTQVGTTSLTYDAAGNMTTDDQGHTLLYDAWNRLVTVKNGSSTLATYIFDGIGRRVKATVSGTTTDSYFSGNQVLENDVGGQATERNVFSPMYVNAVLMREKDTDANGSLDQRLYLTSDANYDITGEISSSGMVLQRQVYSSFGETSWKDASWNAQGSDSYGIANLFQGMQYDSTIGWYVTPNRLYRPSLAYWNRVDPARADGLNWYMPFSDNPVNGLDPLGLFVHKSEISSGLNDLKEEVFNLMATFAESQLNGLKMFSKCCAINSVDWYEMGKYVSAHIQKNRFLWTEKGGWVDMKHFLRAAMETNRFWVPGYLVLDQGYRLEKAQALNGEVSGFGVEDMPSNKMGVDFEPYIDSWNMCDLPNAIERFVNQRLGGAGAPPVQFLDNFNQIRNFTYEPILLQQALGGDRDIRDDFVMGYHYKWFSRAQSPAELDYVREGLRKVGGQPTGATE